MARSFGCKNSVGPKKEREKGSKFCLKNWKCGIVSILSGSLHGLCWGDVFSNMYTCVYAEYEIVHDSYDSYNVLNYYTPPSHFGGVKLVGAHN